MRSLLAGLALPLALGMGAGEALSLPPSLPHDLLLAPSLLGSHESRPMGLDALPRWQDVLARIEAERPLYARCDALEAACEAAGLGEWRALLRRLEGVPRKDQIAAVNRFANRWSYRSDSANYERSDYWATPLQFMERSGDCEDYAIMKYVSLRELGVPEARLRLVVVQDARQDVVHAVLAVEDEREVWILDNLADRVLPQEQVSHYLPYYSVNAESRWMHAAPRRAAGPAGHRAP
ncbi:transglutaminase-like cysteine peptidase [Marinimicrococcus flavescens]|uniref:Transglutaminase-like cysteine peptidase n=1 Tax=Marinimicrococcus flavescens TaxID=3031815 RepID=A0AAP3UXW7_9PROT|nr:transglutaminase-like cysteine peptidase [Marinimicrococcus flavescens]